ncbi:hypothetical protein [Streptomyces sp. NL15-2K]|uniref:hypothetical protein n=1 Tax=Streptomyces sp. NL15-2K TaxID=376149 RepID=UPI000F56AB7D|nr:MULTISPECIES: hypothetical protein [Actinomycetes]WKX14224.1 hypothetical protein Q4V64_44595 [Kutzneria buriramensis]
MTDQYLFAEINVEWPEPPAYEEMARAWLDGGFATLAGSHRQALQEGPKLPPEAMRRSMPCGPPHAAWGFVSITRHDGRQLRNSSRVVSARSMSWFLRQLADPPRTATIGLSVLDERGYPGKSPLRITVDRPEARVWPEAIDWAVLSCRIPEGDLLDAAQQEVVLGFLRGISEGLDPSFANITYDDGLGKTGLERTLGPPWKFPHETIPTSRQVLRGYEWWTICPKELAGPLGGADALRVTGAFHDVVRLPSGALWLQATKHYRDYGPDAYAAVFRALAPALPPGVPKRFDRRNDEPAERILHLDASAVRP